MIDLPIEIELARLHLDVTNPRFGLFSAENEEEALAVLIDTANVKELWASIASRGFERFEPIIAIEKKDQPGEYIVIEGNRRLAACKTLAKPELLGARKNRVPAITEFVLQTIQKLPVIVVKSRKEAEAYIGFKHVNGPSTWNSLAKARFGVQMLKSPDDGVSAKERMMDLTKKLGDSRGMLLRIFVAYKIYEQALRQGIVETQRIDSQKLEFSHLYTMLNHPPSRSYLGLPSTALSEESVVDDPIPDTHLDNLKELFRWLFGAQAVINNQGSDRPRLQKVIASAEGLEALRSSNDLDYAYATAGLGRDDWQDQIHQCAALAKTIDGNVLEVSDGMGTEQRVNAKVTIQRAKQYLESALIKINNSME